MANIIIISRPSCLRPQTADDNSSPAVCATEDIFPEETY